MKKILMGIAGIFLLGALAFGAVKTYVVDPKTISSAKEMLDIFFETRESLPPLPSPVSYEEVMSQISDGRMDFIAHTTWAYPHDAGTFYLSDSSKMAKTLSLPMRLVAYEDLLSRTVVLAGTSDGAELQVLATTAAPEFAVYDETTSFESYLMREIGPRRMIWTAMLKSEKEAWLDLAQVEKDFALNSAPMMMAMSAPQAITNLTLDIEGKTNGVDIALYFPSGYSNKVDIFSCSDLIELDWSLFTNISGEGVSEFRWEDSDTNYTSRFWTAARADYDSDLDGISDSSEIYLHGTDPNDSKNYCVSLHGIAATNTPPLPGKKYAAAMLWDGFFLPWGFKYGDFSIIDQVEVAPDGYFSLDQITVEANTNGLDYLCVLVYQDTKTNGVPDFSEPFASHVVIPTNQVMFYEIEPLESFIDFDYDGIPCWWEELHGLSDSNRVDSFFDSDGDEIINLWEYQLNLEPETYNSNNYAFAASTREIRTRIENADPTTALQLFSTQNHGSGNYLRNTNCWAADIDLTSCSPWNSQSAHKRAGTLISPRHVLFAKHFPVSVGHTLRFVDATNGVYESVLESLHPIGASSSCDLTVGVLSTTVPTNRFSFVKVLPDNYTNYFGQSFIQTPGLCLDQEEKALVHYLRSNSGQDCRYEVPATGIYTNFYDGGVVDGDSGNPCFIILNGEPVLMMVWFTRQKGTSITSFKNEINAAMSQEGYSLIEINLDALGYEELPEFAK